jgi:heme exporter protein B
MKPFCTLFLRDIRLALRQGTDATMVIAFFVIAIALFPLGLGPEPQLLARIAPGLIGVTALLAAMLSLDRLFQQDYEDGSLELLVLNPNPMIVHVIAKVAAHWVTTGLPLMAATPLLAVLLNLPADAMPIFLLAMLLATPSLSLIGAVGAALSLGARRGGVLISLLVLPLYIPVLIFAVGAVDAVLLAQSARPHLLLLAAILAAAIPLCPLVTVAALRQSLD